MHDRLDPDGGIRKLTVQPLYVQLRDALVKRVASGTWRAGDVLPNEIELAREFNLSAGTVRKALELMERSRIIVRQQGRGTFVADPSARENAARFEAFRDDAGALVVGSLAQTQIQEVEADEKERTALRLRAHARVLRIRQLRRIHDTPFMLEQIVVPAALFSDLLNCESEGYDTIQIAKANNVLLGSGSERIALDVPPPDVGQELGLDPTTKVMRLDRVIRGVNDEPVELRTAWVPAGAYHYRSTLG